MNAAPNVIIYGAGNVGVLVSSAMAYQAFANHVVAFVDDADGKQNRSINGIPVLTSDSFTNEFVEEKNVDTLVIADTKISPSKKKALISKAMELKLKVKVVPEVDQWINQDLTAVRLENIKVEELLNREPIVIDDEEIGGRISAKTILVTGAAGSIGSELVRQLLMYHPEQLIVLDQSETPLFDLQFELTNKEPYLYNSQCVKYVVASITDKRRLKTVFEKYRPDIVFHAAAYKHVPMMEDMPYEALCVNVFGTKNLVDLSMDYGVKNFVMRSTDKAVNPTNVMGASKRMAEIYVQSRNSQTTSFVTTRFGNVIGSAGSVVPLFRKQLALGGPLTVTHKDIVRYFMTIREAANLVLEASVIGEGNDIFIFDMGDPVKIYDLAKNMIRLSNMENVEIREVGLRPGEKLFEELLNKKENTLPSKHPKIKHAKVRMYEKQWVDEQWNELKVMLDCADDFSLVAKMKYIVPEFISNNSEFSTLDTLQNQKV